MQDYHVISKGIYNDFKFNDFVSVKQYLLVKEKNKKYLLLKFGNDAKETVSGLRLTVKEFDVRGNCVGAKKVVWDGVNGKAGCKFLGKEKILLDDSCVEVKICLDSAVFGDYVYSVKGKELVVTYQRKIADVSKDYPTDLGDENVVKTARSFKAPFVVVLVSLIMLVASVFGTVFHLISFKETEKEFLWSGVEYSFVNGDKSKGSPVVATGLGDVGTYVNIPAKIEGHPVVAIDENAFQDNKKIKKLKIEGDLDLDARAFSGCTSLTSVELVKTAKVSDFAFLGCTKLESFTAKNLDSIGANAFSGCINLKTLHISHEEKTLSIGDNAFRDCQKLKNITIDQIVAYSNALRLNYFGSCDKLETLHLRNYNCSDYESAFACKKVLSDLFDTSALSELKKLTIDYIDEIPASFCSDKPKLKEVKLGGLKKSTMGAYAFRNCSKLETLDLSGKLTEIGNYALSGTQLVAFDGVELEKIGEGAFENCKKLEEIKLKENTALATIGESAFKNCTALTSFYLPEGVSDLKESVFEGCSGLEKVELSEKNALLSVKKHAFAECSALNSLTLPGTVTIIGEGAFKNCKKLATASLPIDLHSLGNYAFKGCSALTFISVPTSTTSIGFGAFQGCSSLTELILPFIGGTATENRYLSYLFGAEQSDASDYIPSSLSSLSVLSASDIPDYAFYDATGLTVVSLPAGITAIGDHAFERCESLLNLPVLGGVYSIGSSAFKHCNSLKIVNIPSSVESIGESAFEVCANIEEMTLPFIGGSQDGNQPMSYLFGNEENGSLKKITVLSETVVPNAAFEDFVALKEVVLPEGVRSIASDAFRDCYALRKINLPSTILDIAYGAFDNCHTLFEIYNLSELELEYGSDEYGGIAKNALSVYTASDENTHSVEVDYFRFLHAKKDNYWYLTDYVGKSGSWDLPESFVNENGATVNDFALTEYLFYKRQDVKSVAISSAVNSIGEYAFAHCQNLTEVEFAENARVKTLHVATFYECSSLESVCLSGDLENIDSGAFYNCTSLKDLQFSEKLKYLEESAFYNCDSLKSVNFPDTLKEIAKYAFCDCGNLQEVEFGEGLTKIGEYAFAYSSIEQLIFKNSLTTIELGAFQSCNLLTKIEFGASLSELGPSVFMDCKQLESVIFYDDCPLQEIPSNAFAYAYKLSRFEIPSSVRTIKENAFYVCQSLESITLPASIQTIETDAFFSCEVLYEIYNLSNLPIEIESIDYGYVAQNAVIVHKFLSEPSLKTVKSDGLVFKVSGDFCCLFAYEGNAEQLNLSKITLDGKRYDSYWIRREAFAGNTSLKEIVLRDAVTGLGKKAFSSCYNLETVLMGNSRISVIPEYAFAWCGMLTEVECSDLTERIEDCAFTDCNSLRSFTVKNLVNYIGMGAFNYCYRLWEVYDLSPSISVQQGDFEGNGGIGRYALKVNQSASVPPIVYTTVEVFEFFRMDKVWYLYQRSYGDSKLLLPKSFSYDGQTVNSYKVYKNAFEGQYLDLVLVPKNVVGIMENAFIHTNVWRVYYEGTQKEWTGVCNNETAGLVNASMFYYSTCVHQDGEWTYRDGEICVELQELEWAVKEKSTCKKEGVRLGTCPHCDYKQEEPLPLGEHDFNEKGVCKVCAKTKTKINANNFKTYFTDDENYAFDVDDKGNITSTNHADSSTATFVFKATADTSISFFFELSSEATYDYLVIWINEEEKGKWSGTEEGNYSCHLKKGDVLKIAYRKDGSGSEKDDCVKIFDLGVIQ